MSAVIFHKHWDPVVAETDDEVKQTISTTAGILDHPSKTSAVRLTFEKHADSAGGNTPIVRMYRHGTDPTASNGIPIYDGAVYDVFSYGEITKMKFISADGNDHTVYCQWILSI